MYPPYHYQTELQPEFQDLEPSAAYLRHARGIHFHFTTYPLRTARRAALRQQWLGPNQSPTPRERINAYAGTLEEKAARAIKAARTPFEHLHIIHGRHTRRVAQRAITALPSGVWEGYQRELNRSYKSIAWANELWWENHPANHMLVHTSTKDPSLVAYSQSWDKLARDTQTPIKPGKFLTQFCSDVLDAEQIRFWANAQVNANITTQLKVATTTEEFIRVINLGPSESCMSAGFHDGNLNWFAGHIHPAAAYNVEDFCVLYIEDGNGKVTARALADTKRHLVSRIYGDCEALQAAIAASGEPWEQERNALAELRLNRIPDENNSGCYILPYVDAGIASGGGSLYIEDCGTHFRTSMADSNDSFDSSKAYNGKGSVCIEDTPHCTHCGDSLGNGDYQYEFQGDIYCVECIDQVSIVVETRNGTRRISHDDASYNSSTDEYFKTDDMGYLDIGMCEYSDNYYYLDDLTLVTHGSYAEQYIYDGFMVKLDPDYYATEDEPYPTAYKNDTTRTESGRYILDDDVETNDGGDIYHQDAPELNETEGEDNENT